MVPTVALRIGLISITTAVSAITAVSTPALAQTKAARIDVSISAGAASNPFLTTGDDTGSAFAELTISPSYRLLDELGSTSVDGLYRRTEYFSVFDASEAYGGTLRSERRLSEQFTVRALLSFDSSLLGERGSSVIVPTVPVDPQTPAVPDIDPDLSLFGLGQRQNRLRASLGGEYRPSEIDSISSEIEVERISFGGGRALSDYKSYSGSLGYARALSERTKVGGRLTAQLIDYDSGGTTTVLQPQATLDTILSPLWTLRAAAGLLIVSSDGEQEGGDTVGLSASVTGCRQAERSSFCMLFQRDAAPTGFGEVVTRTAGSIDYSHRLGERSNLRAHADLSHVQGSDLAGSEALTYGSASVAYDRAVTERLSGGIVVAYRDIYGSDLDRSADISGQVFLKARVGTLQ